MQEKHPSGIEATEKPEETSVEAATPPAVHNPFDEHHQELSREEEENLEQFKEAQTERD